MLSVDDRLKESTSGSGDLLPRKSARAPILVLLGCVALGVLAAFSAFRIPPPAKPAIGVEVAEVTAERLKERLEREPGLLTAFVGSRSYFEERRIPGAVCVPYAELDSFFGPIDRRRQIVLYCGCCGGVSEGVSGSAARRLMESGFRNVAHLRGHFAAWQAARYPCEGTHPETSEEHAFANAQQKEALDTFVAETRRRRAELVSALESERDPARKAEMDRRLAEADREADFRGLELKRRISVENGDVKKVEIIDQMIEAKRKQ